MAKPKTKGQKEFYATLKQLEEVVRKKGTEKDLEQYWAIITDFMDNWLDPQMDRVFKKEINPMVFLTAMMNISVALRFTATHGLEKAVKKSKARKTAEKKEK